MSEIHGEFPFLIDNTIKVHDPRTCSSDKLPGASSEVISVVEARQQGRCYLKTPTPTPIAMSSKDPSQEGEGPWDKKTSEKFER